MEKRQTYGVIALPVILSACLGHPPMAVAADYDLVTNGGRVMDPETKYDAVANVGIQGGKIYKNTVK